MVRNALKRSVFRFRIEARYIAPPIWREIEVPGDQSSWALHVAIQDAIPIASESLGIEVLSLLCSTEPR